MTPEQASDTGSEPFSPPRAPKPPEACKILTSDFNPSARQVILQQYVQKKESVCVIHKPSYDSYESVITANLLKTLYECQHLPLGVLYLPVISITEVRMPMPEAVIPLCINCLGKRVPLLLMGYWGTYNLNII